MTKHNDPLPKDTKDLKDKDEGKGVAIGEPHPPTAPKDEPACELVEAEVTEVEAVLAEVEPFEPETRTIAEQNADLQAVAFGIPAEVEVEEDSDGEE